MAKSAKDVLDQITMINNINYNNNNNNTIFVSDESEVEISETKSLSGLASLSASQPLEVAFMPQGELPTRWQGVKLDLFENPRLKLKLTIVISGNNKFQCIAALNSPTSYVFRGRNEGKGSDDYWAAVEAVIAKHKNKPGFCISKISKPRKGQTIDGMAAGLYIEDNVYHCAVIYDYQVFEYKLTGKVSDNFRKMNGIATAYIGKTNTRPWADKEELGI